MPIPSGALRFNSDSGKLEYYNGEVWWQIDNFSADNATGGARGVFGGGSQYGPGGATTNIIQYITISTTGNTQDFGDLAISGAVYGAAGLSSRERGIFAGGADPFFNVIQFITISSTGDSQDFGDCVNAARNMGAVSNGTRGVFGGKFTPSTIGTLDYITIASKGDALSFGNLSVSRHSSGGVSSSTRGVFAGNGNTIDFITISTLGNASDFGDLTTIRGGTNGACSNSVRGIFAGGNTSPRNVIDYITISTLGNAIDFGDLTVERATTAGVSSQTRGVFAGGYTPTPAATSLNMIDYVTIMSTGNAIDFGDLLNHYYLVAGLSNGHGGL